MSLARTLGTQSFLPEKPAAHAPSTVSPKQLATVLANGSKSYALAGKFLGTREYADAALLYAWCRQADDRIDDVAKHEVPNALLQLRREVDELYDGQAQGPLAEAQHMTHHQSHYARMQLTNIARDVAEDWQRGRQYLPLSLVRLRERGGSQTIPKKIVRFEDVVS
jgi:phytoene/squalene synthetase